MKKDNQYIAHVKGRLRLYCYKQHQSFVLLTQEKKIRMCVVGGVRQHPTRVCSKARRLPAENARLSTETAPAVSTALYCCSGGGPCI